MTSAEIKMMLARQRAASRQSARWAELRC